MGASVLLRVGRTAEDRLMHRRSIKAEIPEMGQKIEREGRKVIRTWHNLL